MRYKIAVLRYVLRGTAIFIRVIRVIRGQKFIRG
jgi:hypothetical protein